MGERVRETAGRKLHIRNSTVDFLVFTRDAGEDGIEVRVQNHDVWLTQKAIAQLFDVDRSVVTKHLKYRTNPARATQFRQWVMKVLDTFTKQGYVLDKERLINGQSFDEEYLSI